MSGLGAPTWSLGALVVYSRVQPNVVSLVVWKPAIVSMISAETQVRAVLRPEHEQPPRPQ